MKTYVFLANGFEIVEATLPIDIMRRAKIDVVTVSTTGQKIVTASNGVQIVADQLLGECDQLDGDMIFMPGGMPGSSNLSDCAPLAELINAYAEADKWLVAVCAAPLVYGRMGLLNGYNATCYPGFEPELLGANTLKKTVVRDGKRITGCGPGACFALGRAMVAALIDESTADAILRQMMFQVYE